MPLGSSVTAAATFKRLHVPVFDADAAVHALQGKGGRAVAPIAAAFPGTVEDGKVDREALRRAVLGKPEALKRLERIVHPLHSLRSYIRAYVLTEGTLVSLLYLAVVFWVALPWRATLRPSSAITSTSASVSVFFLPGISMRT